MIGITAKIGEFFTGLLFALMTAGVKVFTAGIVILLLTVLTLLSLQYILNRRKNGRDR